MAQNLTSLRRQIADYAHKYQRDPDSVRILAVSKHQPLDAMRAVRDAGQSDFGENYLQEALAKMEVFGREALHWHFIGPLQTNKTRSIAGHFNWVHTVDRDRIARRLNEHRPADLPPLAVCIQVNISGEASKSGVSPAGLSALAATVAGLPQLQLRGLMALPAPAASLAEQRRPFAELRGAFEALQAEGHRLDTLSMGTSADLEAAIAEGATMVRIGTTLFGPRPG
ncbi:MAG: YggS family pyridoxal phosphate-dependent enzyme [Gammaproteobacteria bacterium]|nr:YggS family pyridoxal phosphate-dependent enzyme [Gammaproteobacteria bacterium]